MRLYLIRHPEPQAAAGLCYGRLDVDVGSASLAAALEKSRALLPADVLRQAPLFTSPASRCVGLARALAAPRIPEVSAELAELGFGAWEGRAWNDVPRAQLDDWAADLWCYRPGGGESAQMLAARWHAWLERARALPAEAVVAVTHAGVIRVAAALAGRGSLQQLAQTRIEFGSVHGFDCTEFAGRAALAGPATA
jgi:alpha-ribazole phosphatase